MKTITQAEAAEILQISRCALAKRITRARKSNKKKDKDIVPLGLGLVARKPAGPFTAWVIEVIKTP